VRATAVALAGLLCAVPLAAPAEGTAPSAPRLVVEQTVASVLVVLKNGELSKAERHRRVEDIAYGAFDFPTMSKLVLGRNWRRFSPEQQKTFEQEFKRFLANNYRSRFDGYADEEVEILGERQEPRGDVTVRTRIVGGEFDGTNIDYRLRKRTKGWLVIDVVIEGISLVSNYRDQFKAVLSQGNGPEGLIRKLHKKNEEGGADPDLDEV
jgi:phospholipid transport system substrate-binding protein